MIHEGDAKVLVVQVVVAGITVVAIRNPTVVRVVTGTRPDVAVRDPYLALTCRLRGRRVSFMIVETAGSSCDAGRAPVP